MKCACRILISILFCVSIYAECRNSETCGVPNNCVRCTDTSNAKAGGDVTILSKSSSPIKIYREANLKSCIPCSCGDGTYDEGEDCDDGNDKSSDGCSQACVSEVCGDSYINLPGEECDDGNTNNTDECVCRCDNVCKNNEKPVGKKASCGDGFVYPVTEQCDKGNLNGTAESACSTKCLVDKCLDTAESIKLLCGNGTVDCEEECDDGNTVEGDGCDAVCKNEKLLCDLKVCELTANVKGNQDTDLTLVGSDKLEGTCTLAEIVPQAPQKSSPAISVTGNETKTAWGQYSPWPDPLSNHLTCPAGTTKQNCKFANGNGPLGVIHCSCTVPLRSQTKVGQLCGNGSVECSEQCDDANKIDDDDCSNQCKYNNCLYRVNGGNSLWGAGKNKVFTGVDFDLKKLSCLEKIWGNLGNSITSSGGYEKDDNLWMLLLAWFSGLQDEVINYHADVDKTYAFEADWLTRLNWIYNAHHSNILFKDLFIDENCNPVHYTEPKNVCGELAVSWAPSPISLIWNDEADLNKDWVVSEFKINPFKQSTPIIWKASDAAPLLVWDPAGTKKVKDGSQLFGNYTFAGSDTYETKSVALSSDKNNSDWLWRNGYEAMAKLDYDDNGKLEGSELNTLALWFDENRNAVSDPGEVKSLAELDVVSINVIPDGKTKAGDIYAVNGFSRKTSEGLKSGFTVDWFTQANSDIRSLIGNLKQADSDSVKNQTNEPQSVSSNNSRYEGIWLWKLDSASDDQPASGILSLFEADGKLRGNSIVELILDKNAKKYKSMLKKLPLNVIESSSKEEGLEFEVEANGVKTSTTAKLSDDFRSMNGSSHIIVQNPDSADGKTQLSYTWTASRIDFPKKLSSK